MYLQNGSRCTSIVPAMHRVSGFAILVILGCGPTPRHESPDAAASAPDATVQPQPDAAQASGPVNVVITADNAYSFGYGDGGSITHFTQGVRAQLAGEIFNCPVGVGPEAYTIPAADAPDGAYLYIIAWDDLAVTQGVLGEFRRDTGSVLTGDERFEVCATGLDYSSGPDATTGPTLATINTEIARCNDGTGDPATTSKGWVNVNGATTVGAQGKLAVGETNADAGGTFPIVCQPMNGAAGVSADAHWMWFDPMDGGGDAFHSNGTNRFKAFLIFRLGAAVILNAGGA
jgi:hypothetical protein